MNIPDVNVLRKLGSGSYGDVYEVEKNGEKLALKVIQSPAKEGVKSLRELDIMGRLEHPNLMHADTIFSEYDEEKKVSKVGVLMQKANRDLYDAMYDPKFSIQERVQVLFSVTQGLDFLHQSGYLHMDLKPLNILIFPNNVAKITDFGLAIKLEEINEEPVKYFPKKLITVDHRPINIIDGARNYRPADDVFSLGLIFLEVLSGGRSLFSGLSSEEFKDKTVKEIYKKKISKFKIKATLEKYLSHLSTKLRKNAIKVITKMLKFDPHSRISVKNILTSELFENFVLAETGSVKQPYIPSSSCCKLDYEGFDIIAKIATQIKISIETFFLAVDIYQRALSFRQITDYRNVNFNAILAFYMAVKMIEPYFADANKMIQLAGNYFTRKDLIIGESILINNWQGVIYPNNLFTNSTTLRRLETAFNVCRNCFIYADIDLHVWEKYSQEEELEEGKFDKYSPFNNFIVNTDYYKLMIKDPELTYIGKLYEEDLQDFKNKND